MPGRSDAPQISVWILPNPSKFMTLSGQAFKIVRARESTTSLSVETSSIYKISSRKGIFFSIHLSELQNILSRVRNKYLPRVSSSSKQKQLWNSACHNGTAVYCRAPNFESVPRNKPFYLDSTLRLAEQTQENISKYRDGISVIPLTQTFLFFVPLINHDNCWAD